MNKSTPAQNRKAQEQVIERIRSRRKKYTTIVNGRTYIVYPDVFSPHFVLDSSWYARHLPNQKDKRVLEVGSGTGLIAIIAALQGAKQVLAVDINPHAVRNTKENVLRQRVQHIVKVRTSDIFSAISTGEKFDTIIWNVPWGDFGRGEKLNWIQRAFYDPGQKLLRRFISGAPKHLSATKGRLLIGFSTSVGNAPELKRLLKSAGFSYRIAVKGKFSKGHPAGPITIEFFEAKLS
ncbi:MAG TPA: methyltransferase [Candidatus Paceibacterota bacterium]|jgi:release factor glutamine methyltransferase|nr:methyltransferase [Candidatus Paceibacterota bacterium]